MIVEIDQPSRTNQRLGDVSGDTLMRLVLGRTQSMLPTECTDLHEAIRTPLTGGGSQIYLSASVGVAFADAKVTPVTAMQHAECALDRVIANGGDATFVHPTSAVQSLNMEIAA